MMMTIACGVYRHYKGGYYQVHFIAQHTSFSEGQVGSVLVVYTALTGAHLPGLRVRARPIEEFLGEVWHADAKSEVSGLVKRFVYVGHEIPADVRAELDPSVAKD